MPSVHIWIKKEDWDKWQTIANKPEWLHEHLDMPKATKEGYRSEHLYSVKDNSEGSPTLSFRTTNLNQQVQRVKDIIEEPFEESA